MNVAFAKLAYMAMLAAALSVLLYLANDFTKAGKMNSHVKNIIIGILFGALAILNTEAGVDYGGYVMNVRDAAPVCAGLLFGPIPGVIAGLIGGIERYFAVYWGVGPYTQLACSIGTVAAGLFAALVRVIMFSESRPRWFYGLATGITAEVLHLSLIFVTHPENVRLDYEIVSVIGFPMILANGVAVAVACAIIYEIDEVHRGKTKFKTISEKFQRYIAISIVIALILSISASIATQSGLAENDTKELLKNNIDDVIEQIEDISDENLMLKTEEINDDIDKSGKDVSLWTDKDLERMISIYDVCEVSLINQNGIITASSNATYAGFDMLAGGQSLDFMNQIMVDREIIQPYQSISSNSAAKRKFAGVYRDDGYVLQVGYDYKCIINDTQEEIRNVASHRRIGREGWLMITDSTWTIVSTLKGQTGQHLATIGIDPFAIDRNMNGELLRTTIYDVDNYLMYEYCEGYIVIAMLPVVEANFSRNLYALLIGYLEILVFMLMLLGIIFLIEQLIVRNVHKFNRGFKLITAGQLDVEIEEVHVDEFYDLAKDANATVVKLKTLIDEAAAKVDEELCFAKNIQEGALERVFPPFPKETRFDIHCTMDTAKEVGGDFYDFFFIDDKTFAFEVADVSGKGIPAAMFMMTGKTLIKSMAQQKIPVNEILRKTNDELCAHNEAGMFITCWMGIIDLESGHITYTSAGHNPPLLKRKDGQYEYLKSKINLVLAAMEGVPYDINEVTLEKGDELYIYTDGVTEATDVYDELYGEERLQTMLNRELPETAKDVCLKVKEDLDLFVGEADQFDDITMMSFKYGVHANVEETVPEEPEEVKPTVKKKTVFFEEIDESELEGEEEV